MKSDFFQTADASSDADCVLPLGAAVLFTDARHNLIHLAANRQVVEVKMITNPATFAAAAASSELPQ
jgi:hypothetical protein